MQRKINLPIDSCYKTIACTYNLAAESKLMIYLRNLCNQYGHTYKNNSFAVIDQISLTHSHWLNHIFTLTLPFMLSLTKAHFQLLSFDDIFRRVIFFKSMTKINTTTFMHENNCLTFTIQISTYYNIWSEIHLEINKNCNTAVG